MIERRSERNTVQHGNIPRLHFHFGVGGKRLLAVGVSTTLLALSGVAFALAPRAESGADRYLPKPLLRIDGSTLGRSLEPVPASTSMNTVTLEHDGAVTETPASPKLRALLAAEPQHRPPSPAIQRTALGPDNPIQITDASSYPYSAVGLLSTEDQNDVWSTCTATLIGPRSLVTAAHCVYDIERNRWAKNLIFIPGATDADHAPRGRLQWNRVHVLKGFTTNYDGENYESVMQWDIAEIELSPGAGPQATWMPIGVDTAADFKATMIGYPSEEVEGTMWQSTCQVPATNLIGQIFTHSCPAAPGSSGERYS